MITPEISELLEKTDNRFALCSVVSKRARQLNDELRDAERSGRDAISAYNVQVNFEHDKPVASAVYELYEDKLKFEKVSQD